MRSWPIFSIQNRLSSVVVHILRLTTRRMEPATVKNWVTGCFQNIIQLTIATTTTPSHPFIHVISGSYINHSGWHRQSTRRRMLWHKCQFIEHDYNCCSFQHLHRHDGFVDWQTFHKSARFDRGRIYQNIGFMT